MFGRKLRLLFSKKARHKRNGFGLLRGALPGGFQGFRGSGLHFDSMRRAARICVYSGLPAAI